MCQHEPSVNYSMNPVGYVGALSPISLKVFPLQVEFGHKVAGVDQITTVAVITWHYFAFNGHSHGHYSPLVLGAFAPPVFTPLGV